MVLWTRLTPPAHWLGQADAPQLSALTVRWELAHDPGFRRIAASGQAQALPLMPLNMLAGASQASSKQQALNFALPARLHGEQEPVPDFLLADEIVETGGAQAVVERGVALIELF